MLRDIKETLLDYSIIGGTMAILTSCIKPYISLKESIKEMIICFVFSVLGGLLLEYWNIPYSVKAGLAGLSGWFAVQINAIILAALRKVEENPDIILNKKSDK